MSYLVLARKFRPQNFDEVIGQDHITTTLKNAITQNRVAHAYLFTGPRGIGKTSTARILAKALNCQKGPLPVPCDKCPSCEEIMKGSGLDVIEIDGASNRGIEEVRNLRENVKFAPSRGRFKVYIIDEVHMLTQEAFNALLKTLEEPPAHVKFVFATTAPHKVPATILSRCQRFDFKRIPIQAIVDKLKDVSSQEKFIATEDALFAIAKASEGSMRDAESILDQLASFCDRKMKLEDVTALLGMVEEDILFDTAQLLIDKDSKGALEIVQKILDEGKDLLLFIQGLIEHFRNLMICNFDAEKAGLIDLPEERIKRIKQQSQKFTIEDLLYILNVLALTQEKMKITSSSRIPLEVGLVKLTKRENMISLVQILDKLEKMEKEIPQNAPASMPEEEPEMDEVRPRNQAEDQVGDQTPSSEEAAIEQDPPQDSDILNKAKQVWQEIVDKVKQEKISCGSFLETGQPVGAEGNKLLIGFPRHAKFNYENLQAKGNSRIVEKVVRSLFGQDLLVGFVLAESTHQPPQSNTEPCSKKSADEPIVKSILNIFNGGVTRVE